MRHDSKCKIIELLLSLIAKLIHILMCSYGSEFSKYVQFKLVYLDLSCFFLYRMLAIYR